MIHEQFAPKPLNEWTQLIENALEEAISQLEIQKSKASRSFFSFRNKKKLAMALNQLKGVSIDPETGSYLDEIRFMKPMLKVAQSMEVSTPYPLGLTAALKDVSLMLYYHAHVEIALDNLRTEATDLDNKGCTNKAKVVRDLIVSLEDLNIMHFKDQAICYLTFKEECLERIEEAKSVFRSHQGIMRMLAYVLGLICALTRCSFSEKIAERNDYSFLNRKHCDNWNFQNRA